VREVLWRDAEGSLSAIRTRVFVEEQRVPPELEHDGLDAECIHVVAEDLNGHPIGTGRLRPDGRVGRMAVLREHRGQGVGAMLLDALVAAARAHGLTVLELHAQTSAREFYERAGFRAFSDVFLEAGIPHVAMRRSL
jgi:predicted GNAT family N-acyltransferase